MQDSENPELKLGRVVVGVLLFGAVLFGVTLWLLLNTQVTPWAIRIVAGVVFVGSIITSVCRMRL